MSKFFVGIQPDKKIRVGMKSSYNEEDLHTTLKYLGELTPKELEKTKKVLRDISKRNTDFNIQYNNKKPDIKGNGVAFNMFRTKRLMKLQQDIHKNTGNSGVGQFDKLLYEPHVSVGKTIPKPSYRPEERVDKFYLYKINKKGEKHYTKVDSYKLKNRNTFQKVKDSFMGDWED